MKLFKRFKDYLTQVKEYTFYCRENGMKPF